MAPALAASLVLVGFGVFVLVIVKLAAAHSKRAYDRFAELATRLGLTPTAAQPKFGGIWPRGEATGELRGKRARLYGYTTGSGKNRTTWSALSVRPRELGGLTFSLTRQGLASKFAEIFGAREITVGDPEFDKAWFVQTNQPEFFRAALLPELRTRLAAVFTPTARVAQASLKLERDTVVYAEAGDWDNDARRERFARLPDILCDFADIAEVYAQNAQPGR